MNELKVMIPRTACVGLSSPRVEPETRTQLQVVYLGGEKTLVGG